MVQGVTSFCCYSIYIEVFTFSGLPRRLKWQRILLPMQEMQVWSLGQEDPLDEEMATLSSILIWKIPCTEEPGSPWGHKESDTTEHVRVPVHACACAHTHTHTHSSLPASFVVPHRMWDPSSLTRAQICVSCIGRQGLNHSTTREVHDPWMYLANCTNLLTFLTTCEILSFQNKILNEICLISNWLWYFPEGLWKITKSLFLHLVDERCYNN